MSAQILRTLAFALIAAAAAFWAAWQAQDWRYGEQIFEIRYHQADAEAKAAGRALQRTATLQRKKDEALDAANKRAQRLALESAGLRTVADRLQRDLDAASAQLSSAPCQAVRDYATTLTRVFGQCKDRYRALGERAAGHASDALMFDQAWPEEPPD